MQFLNFVVRHHGLPRSIISDTEELFLSNFWQAVCKKMDIKMRQSSPYHPQTNGQAERTNQTMKQVMRTLLIQHPDTTWYENLLLAEMAINNAPIANTSYSPYYLNYGYHPTFFGDVPDEADPDTFRPPRETVRHFAHRVKETWKDVLAAFEGNRSKMAEIANRHRSDYTFKVIDLVLINKSKHQRSSLGPRTPLSPKTDGPFRVMRVNNRTSVILAITSELLRNGTPTFHSSQLQPYAVRIAYPPGTDDAKSVDDAFGDSAGPPPPPAEDR